MGKSTSLRNLNSEETIIINSDQKALPFKQFSLKYNDQNKNYFKTSDVNEVINILKIAHKDPKIKTVVVDTISHIMTDHIMDPVFRGKNGFSKWGEFSGLIYDLINIINEKLRDDIIVYLIAHPETNSDDFGIVSERIGVQGKQLEKMSPESFSSVVLYAEIQKVHGQPNRHVFRTKSSGNDTCKTPIDMFSEDIIDNDLVIVDKAIREYFGI